MRFYRPSERHRVRAGARPPTAPGSLQHTQECRRTARCPRAYRPSAESRSAPRSAWPEAVGSWGWPDSSCWPSRRKPHGTASPWGKAAGTAGRPPAHCRQLHPPPPARPCSQPRRIRLRPTQPRPIRQILHSRCGRPPRPVPHATQDRRSQRQSPSPPGRRHRHRQTLRHRQQRPPMGPRLGLRPPG
jgi:hypothetical protein